MVMTINDTTPSSKTATLAATGSATSSCPSCGDSLPTVEQSQAELLQAQSRIADLESQVRLLNEKATAAVDRWADYEDELTQLRAARNENGNLAPPPPPPKNEAVSSPNTAEGGRYTGWMSRNKSSPNLKQDSQARPSDLSRTKSTPQPDAEDLMKALTREKSLRKEAEGKLTETSKEVEELSVSLFEQANEMVADERRARAKLEERVDELERRDRDKRRRLDRLESAMSRIERVRNLLKE